MLEEMVAWQPSRGGSRPVPIGSRSIGVSLQPAIPRRVAPQQSPLPLHLSPTIVAQSRSGEAIKCAAQLTARRQSRPRFHALNEPIYGSIPDVVRQLSAGLGEGEVAERGEAGPLRLQPWKAPMRETRRRREGDSNPR